MACIFGCAGETLSRDERRFFADAAPWGFILFARNVASPGQLRRLTQDLRDAVGYEAPVFIDQEGGRVARLGPPHWRAWPPALDEMARTVPDQRARVLWLRYRIIADELRAAGIDANCAPLADIADEATHPVLRNRCYGRNVADVVVAARAVADGLAAGGVLAVLKHIPGHGRARADSHLELPRVSTLRAELDASDFAAFCALKDLPVGMTAHIVYDCLDPGHVATLSAAAIGVIRGAIGFGGLLMSDDISMAALSGSHSKRSAGAIAAGCDVVLHCNGVRAEMEEVASAAGKLTGTAAVRAARALAARHAPEPADIEALDAEYRALTGARAHD